MKTQKVKRCLTKKVKINKIVMTNKYYHKIIKVKGTYFSTANNICIYITYYINIVFYFLYNYRCTENKAVIFHKKRSRQRILVVYGVHRIMFKTLVVE